MSEQALLKQLSLLLRQLTVPDTTQIRTYAVIRVRICMCVCLYTNVRSILLYVNMRVCVYVDFYVYLYVCANVVSIHKCLVCAYIKGLGICSCCSCGLRE
jgi:hypothetical protein